MTDRTVNRTLRSVADLVDAGLVPAAAAEALGAVAQRYAVAVTPAMADLIGRGEPGDPIARQFIPDPAELNVTTPEHADPIGDDAFSPVTGIVHRYPDRVLLKLTHTCPVYCRFCFRREMVGPQGRGALDGGARAAAYGYIRQHPEVWEVILTGGDPLVLSPRALGAVMAGLATARHVKVVRLHTRVPAVDPDRVTAGLLEVLKGERWGKTTYVALHANHPRELSAAARAACARIVDAGIPMVSQTVLLRGINDDVETLSALMRAFVECRIKPYYLHHPDLAPGTSHLRVSLAAGQELVRLLRGRISGLCQPAYVLDVPGGAGKVPAGPAFVAAADTEGDYEVRTLGGTVRRYPPR